jgi:phosphoglucomutase
MIRASEAVESFPRYTGSMFPGMVCLCWRYSSTVEPIHSALDITLVNSIVDPTFSFMTVDHDGKIRMDSAS